MAPSTGGVEGARAVMRQIDGGTASSGTNEDGNDDTAMVQKAYVGLPPIGSAGYPSAGACAGDVDMVLRFGVM